MINWLNLDEFVINPQDSLYISYKLWQWFIYYWWHEFDLLEPILLKKKQILLRKLRDRLLYEESNYFFICQNCGKVNIKFRFDEAFELDFRCPECGNPLEAQENQKLIEFLKKKIVLNQNLEISKLIED